MFMCGREGGRSTERKYFFVSVYQNNRQITNQILSYFSTYPPTNLPIYIAVMNQ
uniref:Uncharacterized protein n=1 Tax=Octopus bimaculoides TaxID=37653 RepID=A0A0L8GJ22_OCTBM